MLAEAIRRLSEFGSLTSYRYIGFGSFYFADFSLFHKVLGISNMMSIEKDAKSRERFLFNKPFGCIDVRFGESNAVLPTLAWDVRSIVWLDYDGILDKSVLTDVRFFCGNAIGGSILVVSVNCQSDPTDPAPVEKLIEEAGWAPNDLTAKDLAGWGKAAAYRRILKSQIDDVLTSRNGVRAPGSKFLFRQLFNFRYADGARMLTYGGLVFDEGQRPLVAKCSFEDLGFVREADEPYLIEVPKLTFKEVRHLDAQLPASGVAHLIYVERSETGLQGIVRYFGAYQYFCQIGPPRDTRPPGAFLAVLDPVGGAESVGAVPPLKLSQPPTEMMEGAAAAAMASWATQLYQAARQRGASASFDVTLRGRTPNQDQG